MSEAGRTPAQPVDAAVAAREPLGRLFLRFLRFGALAWGGPFAQIAMIRQELVDRERWVSPERFNRALALYQALPGPEAHELCVYFGTIARGRIGGLLAGLGFMLPGFLLMLLASRLYTLHGLASPLVSAAFAGVRPIVAALVARATWTIGARALSTPALALIGAGAAALEALAAPFWITLTLAGAAHAQPRWRTGRVGLLLIVAVFACVIGAWAWLGPAPPASVLVEAGIVVPTRPAGPAELFGAGLTGGMLSFGGAYTAIPFVQEIAVGDAARPGWMTGDQFLDGLAIGGVLPAPLVIFSTFVGFIGGGFLGAFACTAGMFLPAFAFTLLGHRALERLLDAPRLHGGLDGIAAAVVGIVAVTAVRMAIATVGDAPGAAAFVGALVALTVLQRLWIVPALVGAGAAIGIIASRA